MLTLIQEELTTLANDNQSSTKSLHQTVHHRDNINHQIIPYAIFVANFFVQTAICLLGSVLNLVVCCVFSDKKFADAVYFYMAALSLADVGTLLSMFPVGLLRCDRVYFNFCSSKLFVKLRVYLFYFTIHAGYPLSQFFANLSALLTVVLATERYCAMKYYKRNNSRCQQINARFITLAVTFFTLFINIPYFFVMKISHNVITNVNRSAFVQLNASMSENRSSHEAITNRSYVDSDFTSFGHSWIYSLYSWCVIVLMGFLPFFILCLANVFLLILVNHKPFNHKKTPLRLRAERKLTVLLITVIFLFLFGQIPRAFTNKKVFSVFFPQHIYDLFRIIGVNISLFCHSLNFFVYLGLNRHFRNQLLSSNLFCLFFQKMFKRRFDQIVGQEKKRSDKYKTACVKFSCTTRTNSTLENLPKFKMNERNFNDKDCLVELIAIKVAHDAIEAVKTDTVGHAFAVENLGDLCTNAIVHCHNENTSGLNHKTDVC